MGLLDIFGSRGARNVKRKMEADEKSYEKIKMTAERETKASGIAKKHGVSLEDAREYIAQEQRRDKGKANLAKLKAGIKGAQEWKKKHIMPINTKTKKIPSMLSPKPVSVLTWGKPTKRRKK